MLLGAVSRADELEQGSELQEQLRLQLLLLPHRLLLPGRAGQEGPHLLPAQIFVDHQFCILMLPWCFRTPSGAQ